MSTEGNAGWDGEHANEPARWGPGGWLEIRRSFDGPHDGYEFGDRISAIGEVYEGRHPRIERPFVIKLLGYLTEDRAAEVAAFSREAGLLSILHHPHIAQVLASGVLDHRTPFVAMERLYGRTLEEHLNLNYPMPLSVFLPVLRGIVSALSVAHAAGVVHREIRPDNVFLVDATAHHPLLAKVLDFGVSRLTGDMGANHREISVDDSRYRAPEQGAESLADVDSRADQFAVAALVCRVLRGVAHLPCNPVSTRSACVTHQERAVSPPLMRRVSFVRAVLVKALSESPDERYPSVAEFLQSLEEAFRPSGSNFARANQARVTAATFADEPSGAGDIPIRAGSHSVRVMVAACVAVSLAAWGLWGALRTSRHESRPVSAVQEDEGSGTIAPISVNAPTQTGASTPTGTPTPTHLPTPASESTLAIGPAVATSPAGDNDPKPLEEGLESSTAPGPQQPGAGIASTRVTAAPSQAASRRPRSLALKGFVWSPDQQRLVPSN